MANFQNITAARLGQVALTTTVATIYTTPALTKTFVKQIDICNTTNGTLTVNVHIVPALGTAGTANAIYYTFSIVANSVLQWKGVQIMDAGDTLQAKGSSTGLTLTASGGVAV
jgi:hypothetical protein